MTEEEEKLAKAYLGFTQSVEGQIILKDLREKFFERSLVADSTNTNQILLEVGAREVLIYILSMIERLEYERSK